MYLTYVWVPTQGVREGWNVSRRMKKGKCACYKNILRPMTPQWVKVPVTEPDNLSSIPEIHMVAEVNQLLKAVI